jgi:ABC-type hemin transport system ATPase subunit
VRRLDDTRQLISGMPQSNTVAGTKDSFVKRGFDSNADGSILRLDEPTICLDIAHRVELTERLCRPNREGGRTLVALLHDLNQACRYADHIIALRAGRILA